jgi:hypothetical protein
MAAEARELRWLTHFAVNCNSGAAAGAAEGIVWRSHYFPMAVSPCTTARIARGDLSHSAGGSGFASLQV